MPACVGNLCPECRPKCINVGKCTTKVFDCKLPRYCQGCFLLEEFLRIIDFSVNFGDVLDLSIFREAGGHLEHLSCSLTISCCDNGGVNVKEPVVLEELMSRKCQVVLDSCDRGHNLSPRP